MPDVAAVVVHLVPMGALHFLADGVGRIVLVRAHHLQHFVVGICHGVEANELVRHRYGEEGFTDTIPLVYRLVIEVRPVEIVILVEAPQGPWIGEIDCLFRRHCNKELRKREEARVEDALVCVFLNLVGGLADGDAGFLEFDMDYRHTVNEEGQISSTV